MSKCFITKYPVAIDNDNLPRINTMRIKFQRVDRPTSENRSFRFNYPNGTNVTFHYIGNGHFTDSTLTQNLGKEVTKTWGYVPDNIYMSNDEGEVEFDISKIESLQVGDHDNVNPDGSAATNLTCDLNHLKGRIQVTKINMPLANNNVKLDLSSIKDLVKMWNLAISYSTQVTGDIANLANMKSMTLLDLNNTQVTGDIANLANMKSMTLLNLNNTQVSGKIDSLANLTKLTNIDLRGLSLTGDMSKIPTGINFISQSGRKVTTNFTWTAKGRQNATLLAMEGAIPFDTASMDNMLIDQAACTFKPTSGRPWLNTISVSGTRTSASDEAIATIQNMGVTITGVTKQA